MNCGGLQSETKNLIHSGVSRVWLLIISISQLLARMLYLSSINYRLNMHEWSFGNMLLHSDIHAWASHCKHHPLLLHCWRAFKILLLIYTVNHWRATNRNTSLTFCYKINSSVLTMHAVARMQGAINKASNKKVRTQVGLGNFLWANVELWKRYKD